LPCLFAILRKLPPVDTAIIDGYVWLAGESRPGLGAHLYGALNQKVVVIGVAKTKFHGADHVSEVIRGSSNVRSLLQPRASNKNSPLDARR
jgi:deoxyribonuclease V